MNEKGNTTLLGLVLIMAISFLFLFLIKKRIEYTKAREDFQKLLLCSKETNGATKEFYDKISESNTFLKALTITEYTTITIPIYGVIASKSAAQAIRVIKAIQVGYLISYLNKLRVLTQKECYLSPNIYKTPFELQLSSGFKRNEFEEAKIRGNTWKYINFGAQKIVVTKLQFTPNWSIKSSLLNKGLPL